MITNQQSGTNIHEVADGIYRINTPIALPVGSFSFNQYLIVDEKPLLFHTGPRRLFPLVREAIAGVTPVERLAAAPDAVPVCSQVAAMVSINDIADRAPQTLGNGETLGLGRHALRWFDTPHLPHGWDCGFMFDDTTRTLLCGDLFTQPGDGKDALVETDILGVSEAFRGAMDYYAHAPNTTEMLERLAGESPTTLACMHGSAWRGDGGALLRALAASVEQRQSRAA